MLDLTQFFVGFQRRLGNIIRFNTRPRTQTETVAAHSFYVALYALILAIIVEERGKKIDHKKTLVRALLHDLEECIAGDVMTKMKQDPDLKDAYDKVSKLAAYTALSGLPENIRMYLFSEWSNHKEGDEGWLVNVADDLSGVIYCKEQINLGNKYFIQIGEDYLTRIKKKTENTILSDLYDSMKKSFETDSETKLDSYAPER